MVTPSPFMASRIPSKSPRCIGRILFSASRRPSTVSDRIISRIASIRCPSKNICSVRQSPTPLAPKSRALRASFGVSALVRTYIRVYFSARFMMAVKSSSNVASSVSTFPK